jgi:hypothetical protein
MNAIFIPIWLRSIIRSDRARMTHTLQGTNMTETRNSATAALLLRLSLGTMFIAHAMGISCVLDRRSVRAGIAG